MFEKAGRIGITLIATLVIWFSVGMIDLITGDHVIRNFAAILAFIFMLIAWLLVITTDSTSQQPYSIQHESDPFAKSKRATSAPAARDPRLALLLDLMDDNERRDLKARLVSDLSADGDISLADLLASQEDDAVAYREDQEQ